MIKLGQTGDVMTCMMLRLQGNMTPRLVCMQAAPTPGEKLECMMPRLKCFQGMPTPTPAAAGVRRSVVREQINPQNIPIRPAVRPANMQQNIGQPERTVITP